jgi:sigma-B regulation protein RsbU (phosphoserine phosphatase)
VSAQDARTAQRPNWKKRLIVLSRSHYPLARRFSWLLLLLIGLPTMAQMYAATQQPVIRYHFGENPDGSRLWTSPEFNDSDWPQSTSSPWPKPPYPSDGIIWVRIRAPVSRGEGGPLALRQISVQNPPGAEEIYVNGVLVGVNGKLPPHPTAAVRMERSVFPLDPLLVSNAPTALVAVRLWMLPVSNLREEIDLRFVIDRAEVLETADREERQSLLLARLPVYAAFFCLGLLGLGLLAFWRISGDRDLALFGFLLVSGSAYVLFMILTRDGHLALTQQQWDLLYGPLQFLSPFAAVLFSWTFYDIPSRFWKYAAYTGVAVMAICAFAIEGFYYPNAALPVLGRVEYLANAAFGLIIIGGDLWAVFNRPSKRLLAAVTALSPIASIVSTYFSLPPIRFGSIVIGRLAFTILISGFAIAAILARRTWKTWRQGVEFRIEFNAAREVQQQLVPPAVDLPGFKIQSVYAPAKQVGGDFFRVLPEEDGAVLVVVGDVSGKGLKAAMAVSAIMGALQDYPSRRPTDVLAHLNRVVYGQVSGFVTCCVALIATDGAITIANAGNPAPYHNGVEMTVEPGLPLGIIAEASYAETRSHVAPGDRLTFVSDGVIEAINPQRELYGFERTQAVSNQPANAIAEAATLFGQEDDITVVTVTRESVRASAGAQFPVT